MTTQHTFCIPGSCAGANYRTSIRDPNILKKVLGTLTTRRKDQDNVAFSTGGVPNSTQTTDINLSLNFTSDINSLPIIPQQPIGNLGLCMSVLNPIDCSYSDIYNQFLCIIHFLSNAYTTMLDFSSGNSNLLTCAGLQFYVIFDGKINVFYGTLVVSGSTLIMNPNEPVQFIFPPLFLQFSFGLYDSTTNTYYFSQAF